jgi:hypothetical protein
MFRNAVDDLARNCAPCIEGGSGMETMEECAGGFDWQRPWPCLHTLRRRVTASHPAFLVINNEPRREQVRCNSALLGVL